MLYFSKIKAIREIDDKTEVLLSIDGNVKQKLMKYKQSHKSNIDAEIYINDKRKITSDQRKMIYATINDISDYTGNPQELLKEYFKYKFMIESGEEYFSLSRKNENAASINIAKEFINFLIEFVLAENIPLSELALLRTEDIDKYLYYCLKYKRCAITGKKAQIHHVTRVGMGRNRNKIDNTKMELIALSKEWHDRVHQEGEKEIFEKYKIYGIKLDIETLKYIGLSYEDIS